MIAVAHIWFRLLADLLRLLLLSVRGKRSLEAENLFLRRQLALYKERGIKPRRIDAATRMSLVLLSGLFDWRDALVVVRPETLIHWHRAGWRLLWRWKCRPGRPPIPLELRQLIRRMATENRSWGEERIANELLLKLGVRVSPRTVRKYMPKRPAGYPRGDQRWSTFLRNHARAVIACDFFVTVTATFRSLYVFVVIHHSSRRLVHFNVTEHPTSAWTLQQLREAVGYEECCRSCCSETQRPFGTAGVAVDACDEQVQDGPVMAATGHLLQLLILVFCGWLQRQQAEMIEYLKTENRMLRQKLGGRRILFTDAERRSLASRAYAIGRKALAELNPIVTPETLLRWHRELVVRKWTCIERRRPGRPRTRAAIEALIARMATDNPAWGYTRLMGAMSNLGYKVGRGTVRRILKDHGMEPAPTRGKQMPWSVFLKAHWKLLAASDFFSVEVWSWRGLVTYYVLFVIELATRKVLVAGVTTHPDTGWMLQMARHLTDAVDGVLVGKRYLILDRDAKYCEPFRAFLKREGIEVIRLPPRSPNLNAYAERWVGSVRSECLSKLIPIGQGMLRRALRSFGEHYHQERNHQGLGNALIVPRPVSDRRDGPVVRRPRLGGLLNFYERAAA